MLLGRPFEAKMVTLGLLLLMCLSQPSQVLGAGGPKSCFNESEVPHGCFNGEEACVATNIIRDSLTEKLGCLPVPIILVKCVIKQLGQSDLNNGQTNQCLKGSDAVILDAALKACSGLPPSPAPPGPPAPPGEPAKRSARELPTEGPPYWLCYCTTDDCNKGITPPTWPEPTTPGATGAPGSSSDKPTPSGGPGGGPAGNGAEGIKNTAVGLVASIVLAAGLLCYHRR